MNGESPAGRGSRRRPVGMQVERSADRGENVVGVLLDLRSRAAAIVDERDPRPRRRAPRLLAESVVQEVDRLLAVVSDARAAA